MTHPIAPEHPSRQVIKGRALLFFLFACCTLLFLRAPRLLISPRLWAEEGTKFYAAGFALNDFWQNLLFLERNSGGYYNFPAVLAAAIANVLPMEFAPTVFTYVSVVTTLLPIWVIVSGPSYFAPTHIHKVLAALIFLCAPSATPEVWLNTVNAQVYCGLTGVCILGEDLTGVSRRRLLILSGVLFFCSISGIYCTFLLPAFSLKLLINRNMPTFWIWLSNAIPAAIQSVLFVYLKFQNALSPKKMGSIEWYEGASHTFYHQYLIPLLPREFVQNVWYESGFSQIVSTSGSSPHSQLYGSIALLFMMLIVSVFAEWKLKSMRWTLVTALLTVALCTNIASVGGVAGGRYAFLPGAMLLLLITTSITSRPRSVFEKWRSYLASSLLFVSLSTGIYYYFVPRTPYTFCMQGTCPVWRTEVARFRLDKTYRPQVWPVNPDRPNWQWRIKLHQ